MLQLLFCSCNPNTGKSLLLSILKGIPPRRSSATLQQCLSRPENPALSKSSQSPAPQLQAFPLPVPTARSCFKIAGFAIADVNYGGSTGYGRSYRNRLRRKWGIVDVADCSNAAKHLAKQGKADEKRLCIDGGSAGGYTTLACLAFR